MEDSKKKIQHQADASEEKPSHPTEPLDPIAQANEEAVKAAAAQNVAKKRSKNKNKKQKGE